MMNDNHKNSGCGFAEDLISHLYGENDAAENAAFTAHLETCSTCAEELEAFAGVQFSISNWKSKEFAALETPFIEIPYPTASQKQAASPAGVSWLSRLRGFWSFSPAMSLAIASVAILSVALGIVLLTLNSPTGADLAESSNGTKPVINAPAAKKSPETTNVDREPKTSAEKEIEAFDGQKTSAATVEDGSKNNRVVKKPNKQRQAQKPEPANSPKNIEAKRRNTNKAEPSTPVMQDEDEDDTLRLAELFEEIDTKD